MTQLKKGIALIKKVGDGIYDFIDSYNDQTLYVFDFEDVKAEYFRVLKNYGNASNAMNLEDFSKNYAFTFFFNKSLEHYKKDGDKISHEIHDFLKGLKAKGDI